MKHPINFILLLFLFVLGGHDVEANESPFEKKLNEFIGIALKNNPQLREAQNQIEAAQEVPPQASSLEDPMLMFELKNVPVDSFAFDERNMTQKQVTLSQRLPFPGKLGLREEMALREADMTEQNYEELKLRVIRDVKQSYYELCFILVALDITRQNKTLLEQFVSIAETKYSVGKGIQQDVLKAQVELSKILDELILLQKRKESEQAQLNSLMDRLPQEPLVIPHGIKKAPFDFSIVELQRMAEDHRPLLKQIRLLKDRFFAAKKLAEREYYPDFNLGLRYSQREDGPFADRPDFLSAFVGINIPLWYQTKQSRKVAEESARINQVQETYNKKRNDIFLRTKELFDEESKGAQRLELIKTGILPQARQSLESAVAGYTVDKVDFLTLLDNQVTLFNWEIKYHRELTDYQKTLAALEQTVGKSLY